MNVKGKVALVTGGSDGIGREIALQLQAAGAQVTITGRSAERLKDMASRGFRTIAAELSEKAGIDAIVTVMTGQPLALLVNNAGMGSDYDPDDATSLASAEQCLRTNVEAPIALCTRLIPVLRAQPAAMIVNVTSGLAIAPRAGGSIYCASKAALRSYTQAIRFLYKDSSLRIVEALPPVVETKMTAGRDSKKMSATDCAAEIVRGILNDKAEINIGMVKLLKLVHSVSPALARRVMLRF